MKIGHIIPPSIKFPLNEHSGRYLWVKNFIEEVSKTKDTDIVLFGNKESSFDNPNIKVIGLDSLGLDKKANNLNLWELAVNYPGIDILHSHFDNLHYEMGSKTSKKIVFTQHWKLTKETIDLAKKYKPNNVYAIPVTKYQLNENTRLNILSTPNIYHGVKLDSFKFDPNIKRNNKLVFVGRIAKHKGVKEAVELALQTHEELDIYGKIEEKDESYWKEFKDLVDGKQIRYLGSRNYGEIAGIFAEYKAFLFPVQDIEAFGLVFIEAMATGTPVLTLDIGPIKEIVEHNYSGFVAKDLDKLAGYIKRLNEIKNENCRLQAEKFSFGNMVNNYVELYNHLLSS